MLSELRTADLTKVEQQVCKFIQNYPRHVINLSLEELSKQCFVSQATIIRLCKKMHCKGFADFKIKLASELSSVSSVEQPILQDFPLDENASTDDVMKTFYNLAQQALKSSFASLDPKNVIAAAQLLAGADKIQLYGRGASLLAAEDFHYKLLRLGYNSSLESLNGFQEVINTRQSKKLSTVAIVISQYCNSQQVHYVIDELANSRIPFIIITANNDIFPYDKFASMVFHLQSSESRQKIGSFASRTAMHYLLDCIYGQLFLLDYAQNMKNLMDYAHRKAECKYYYREK